MQTLLMANNASSILASSISNTATTANLSPGSGALFPQPVANQYFKLTFTDAATQTLREIVHVTNVATDTITMLRAQEGTTALAWSANDFAVNLITAGTLQAMAQQQLIQGQVYTYAADTGAANAYAATYSPVITALTDGMKLKFKASHANTGASTFAPNGLSAYPILGQSGLALQGGEIVVNGIIEVVWNVSLTSWELCGNAGGALSVLPATQANQAINLGQFLATKSANGYVKLPNGIIIQWGTTGQALPAGNNAVSFALPIAFTTSYFAGVVSDVGGGCIPYGITQGSDLQHIIIYCPAYVVGSSGTNTARAASGASYIVVGI
ncbi:gp53-like domain-containing protein [Martelella alba]|uniref:Putative tail fiber protein gp53-like C-terminal domain-containing protein n=1 Tax=Martelella alba TaxID=2590451 RepID=A0ABY2SV70_9HYPH|nr:hypothetical protein [Martelella alba]TKI08334.1 hypothetical protein FCN80_04105 [Martelella alba]